MNRFYHLPHFSISSKEDVDLFVGAFFHSSYHIAQAGEDILYLQDRIAKCEEKGDFEEATKCKEDLVKWIEIKPFEEKSSSILNSLLTQILEHCSGDRTIYIFFAEQYNDRYYHDLYSMYYSSKHFAPNSICSRFFLFDGALVEEGMRSSSVPSSAFIGTIVRRPLQGREIGRTLIDPKYLYGEVDSRSGEVSLRCNIWRNNYRITMFGVPLSVWAFPYTMQDGEVATCAETTILNMSDYYSYRYPEYKRVLPHEIIKIVQRNSNTRSLPSTGLSYDMVSKVFLELGFSPIIYSATNFRNRFADILHSYVASGIPVALGINDDSDEIGHSVIVIGTEQRMIDSDSSARSRTFKSSPILYIPKRERGTIHHLVLKGALDNSYIIMDDGRGPYSKAKIFEENGIVYLTNSDQPVNKWKVSIFVVPMGIEMSMDADAAITTFRSILINDLFGYSDYIHRITGIDAATRSALEAGFDKENPLLTRIFLCPSKRLKEQRIRDYERKCDWQSIDLIQNVHFPRFVWVCELYTESSYSKDIPECVGEIVLDATTGPSPNDDFANIIWIRYPWKYAFRKPTQSSEDLNNQMKKAINFQDEMSTWQPSTPFRFELH